MSGTQVVVRAAAVLALFAGVTGCTDELATPAPLTITAPEPTQHCGPGRLPALQGGTHLLGDTEPPVPWSSTPATSGWHSSGLVGVDDLPDPVGDAELVSLLEGGPVAALHDDRLAADEVAALEDLAAARPGRLAVARYAGELESPVVLVGWGVLQPCETVDAVAVDLFTLRHFGLALSH